jgi:hypothetical protein
MPKCAECRHEGPYNLTRGTFVIVSGGSATETPMKYMQCQAPEGVGTENPISQREALTDMPCRHYQPKEKPQPRAGLTGLFARVFEARAHAGVRFKEKSQQEAKTYEVYSASSKDEAFAFLRSKAVPQRLYYIVVETPEGSWGLDVDGIYQEK